MIPGIEWVGILFEELPAWQATVVLLGLSIGVAMLLELFVLRSLLAFTEIRGESLVLQRGDEADN